MKKNGFTLAEVLVTLVILGILAVILVPAVLNNTDAQEFRSTFKKSLASINQALALNYSLDGISAADYSTAEELVANIFKKRMNVIKGDTTHTFDGKCTASEDAKFTTMDGIMFCINNFESSTGESNSKCSSDNKTVCGDSEVAQIIIDVNGIKKPNKLTVKSTRPRDIYEVQLYAQRVIPYGEAAQTIMITGTNDYSKLGDFDLNPPNSEGDNESNDGGPEPDIEI